MLIVKLVPVLKQINVNLVMRMITEPSEKMENVVAQKDSMNKTNLPVPHVTCSVKLVSDLAITNVQAAKENTTVNQLKAPALAKINLLLTKPYQVESQFASEKTRNKSTNVWKDVVMKFSMNV